MFSCNAYVLRTPRRTKFEPCAIEVLYLKILEYLVLCVFITGKDCIQNLLDTRHVTFEKSKAPGMGELAQYMNMEEDSKSDEDFHDSDFSFKFSSEIDGDVLSI